MTTLAGAASAIALLVVGGGLVLAAMVDLTDGADSALALAAAGAGALLVGGVLWRACWGPQTLRGPDVIAAVVVGWLVASVASAAGFLATGAVGRVDDALFEGIAGITTTNLSTIAVEEAERGVLFWRATSQWIGGLGALILAVIVLPTFGQAQDVTDSVLPDTERLPPRIPVAAGGVLRFYAIFTAAMAVAYLAAGMGPFDAVTHSFTTVSTGGYSNHVGSIGQFDSAAVEWVAIFGMILAGSKLATLAWGFAGGAGSLLRSFELRVYFALILVASFCVAAWTWQSSGGDVGTVRTAVFTVASASSTTGYFLTDWGVWPWSAQVLLLILVGVGAMAGSAGGGFRLLRVIELVRYANRELIRQLHPQAVVVIKVDGKPVSEHTLARMTDQQTLFTVTAALGAFGLAALGLNLIDSIPSSISALATFGPGFGEIGPTGGADFYAAPARAVLMALMLIGRLAIYPVLLSVGGLVIAARRVRL